MTDNRPTAYSALERLHTDLLGKARGLLSASQVSPNDLRQIYNRHAAILFRARDYPEMHTRFEQDFEGLRVELDVKVTAEVFSIFQELRYVMGMLPLAGSDGAEAKSTEIISKSQGRLPLSGSDSVDARVATYDEISHRMLRKLQRVYGQYIGVGAIAAIGDTSKQTVYRRIRGKRIPKRGTTYLVDDSTVRTLFGLEKIPPIAAQRATEEETQGQWMSGKELMNQFGYKDRTKFYRLIHSHPEIKRRNKKRWTQYYVTKDNNGIFENKGKENRFEYRPQAFVSSIDKVVQTQPPLSGGKLANDTWMHRSEIKQRFGCTLDKVYEILRQHPEIKSKGNGWGRRYNVTEEIEAVFKANGQETATAATTVQRRNDSGVKSQKKSPADAAHAAIGSGDSDLISYDGMLWLVGRQVGSNLRDQTVVEILDKYGSEVQRGANAFSRQRLEGILAGRTRTPEETG